MRKKNATPSERPRFQGRKQRQQISALMAEVDALVDEVCQKLEEVKQRPESQCRIHYKVKTLTDDGFENWLDKKYDDFRENTLYIYPAIVEKQTSFVECYLRSPQGKFKCYEVPYDALGLDLSDLSSIQQNYLDQHTAFFCDCPTYQKDLFSLKQLLEQMQTALRETQQTLKQQSEEHPQQIQQHLEQFKVDCLSILKYAVYQEEIRHHRSQAFWKPLLESLDNFLNWVQQKIGYEADFTVNFFSTATHKKIAVTVEKVNHLTVKKSP